MKATVDKRTLIEALQRVHGTAAGKSTMPILSNVLIEPNTESQVLMLTATDLELSVWTKCSAKIEDPSPFTVQAKRLLDIVKELPQETVSLTTTEANRLIVKSGRSRFELATIPSTDYPEVKFPQETQFVRVDNIALRRTLNRVLHAMAGDNDPFSVAGMFVHTLSPITRFVSTDGHRLAYADGFLPFGLKDGIIIPRKGIVEILKLTERKLDSQVTMDGNSICFRFSDSAMSIQLIDSKFPEYQVIIPEDRPNSVRLPKEELIKAVKRVGVMADGMWKHLTLHIAKDLVELKAGGSDSGEGIDALDISYDGDEFTVAFNLKYAMDAISCIEGEVVRFEWVDQFHGGVFCGDDDNGISIVMPMVL